MEIYGEPNTTLATFSLKRKKYDNALQTLSTDLHEMFNNKKHSDVVIICGPKTFYAHKMILSGMFLLYLPPKQLANQQWFLTISLLKSAARSKIFRVMFDSEMEESESNQVVLTDIDFETMHAVLLFIYTGEVKMNELISYTELIYGAEKYDLPELKRHCFRKMFECVTEETFGMLAVAALTYNADTEFQESVEKYCLR